MKITKAQLKQIIKEEILADNRELLEYISEEYVPGMEIEQEAPRREAQARAYAENLFRNKGRPAVKAGTGNYEWVSNNIDATEEIIALTTAWVERAGWPADIADRVLSNEKRFVEMAKNKPESRR